MNQIVSPPAKEIKGEEDDMSEILTEAFESLPPKFYGMGANLKRISGTANHKPVGQVLDPIPEDGELPCVPFTPGVNYSKEIEGEDSLFEIHISKMILCDVKGAQPIAEYILDILEEDLFNYFNALETDDYGVEEMKVKARLARISNASISSDYPDPLPGEPSQLDLFYEGEVNFGRPRDTRKIRKEDVAVEANLHRKIPKIAQMDGFTMTKEMTFLDPILAELVFRHTYPMRDDYRPLQISSRQESLENVLKEAAIQSPKVDRPKLGPKIRWSERKRLLPLLPQDYFKEETYWTGSVYRGQYVNRQFTHGRFEYPLMSVYESEFKKGQIHSEKHMGLITYPRGDRFEGEWTQGRHVSGKITFADDLEFEQHNWGYCQSPDRRFYIERDIGVKQTGKTIFNDRYPPPLIPCGHYDTGYGIFDPDTGIVWGYGGEKMRQASYAECKWILQTCRKVKTPTEIYRPSFHSQRLPGSSIEKYMKQ